MPTITKTHYVDVEIDLIDALDELSTSQLRELRIAIDQKIKSDDEELAELRQAEYMESLFDSLRRNDERRALEIARALVCDALGRVC